MQCLYPLTLVDRNSNENNTWCPDSEVRIIVRQPHLRTSESKDTSNSLILVWLRFRSPQFGLAARMLQTSEPPH